LLVRNITDADLELQWPGGMVIKFPMGVDVYVGSNFARRDPIIQRMAREKMFLLLSLDRTRFEHINADD
jgi:hypothetical protein